VSSVPPLGSEVTVLYILGAPRSATTLLGNILGETKKVFHAGELRFIWERNLVLDKRRCACGQKIVGCEVWSPVVEALMDEVPPDLGVRPFEPAAVELGRTVFGWQQHVSRRGVRTILTTSQSDLRGLPDVARYVAVMSRLYRSIADVAGASVIVDSSKWPTDAALLHLVPGVTPRFVHLVRDPRGVAFSRQRKLREGRGVLNGVNRVRVLVADALWWNRVNAESEQITAAHADEASFVRYEDFVREPKEAIAAIQDLVGIASDTAISPTGAVHLHGNHTVGGNRNRRTTGSVQLREDDRWTRGLSRRDRLIVDAVTRRLRARYEYLGTPFHTSTDADHGAEEVVQR
jgi:hypothetical protein